MAVLQRRTHIPMYKKYQEYKRYLREDFLYGCVYCTVHENEFGGHRHFHVDHFRPKTLFPKLLTVYNNLIYSCGVCNSFKLDDWPSDNPLTDGKGYIDPCEHDYRVHFKEKEDGEVEGLSTVAVYMIERLHLNRRQLRRLRERRKREEQIHEQLTALCAAALVTIEEALQEKDTSQKVQRALTLARGTVLMCKELHDHEWSERWQPQYGWEDYR